MNNPLAKVYNWQISSGQLDGWTSYHLAAGLFIAKVAQWLGASDLWAVLWVLIIGILWEIFEYFITKNKFTRNLLIKYWFIPKSIWDEDAFNINRVSDIIFNMLGYHYGNISTYKF